MIGGIIQDVKAGWRQFLKAPRKITSQTLKVCCIILTAFVGWRCLMLATNCESPVVVVLSGSMEPGMYRGDILLLAKRETYDVGDIVVYKIPERDIPIVHRVLAIHERRDEPNDPYILTKGDNNYVDDRGLYNPGTKWLRKSDVMGTAFGFLPTLGVVTIYLNDYPLYLIVSSLPCSFKWALLSALFLLLASGKDV